MRKNLKVFRVRQDMTQGEMADRIGYTRAAYASIEKGKRDGRDAFWNDFQRAFNLEDSEMWTLMKNE